MSAVAATGRPSWARRPRRLAVALAAGGVLLGLLAGQLVASGHTVAVAGLAVVVLPVALWKRPDLAPALLIGAALAIEQFVATPPPPGVIVTSPPPAPPPLTAHIPLFHGIGGLHLAPADLLLLGIFVVFLLRSVPGRRPWPRSATAMALLAIMSTVVLGVAVGLAHHGDARVSLMETRPYVYLAGAYVLTAVLATTRAAIRAVLWALVLAVTLKAVQGLVIFVEIRHMRPRPEAVLGHEEAVFFALYIILVLALWLFDVRGTLRRTATWLLPLVAIADLANNRRAAWLVLGGSLCVLAAVGLRRLPARRHLLVRVVAVAAVGVAVYLPAFWNKSGGLAQPARALHSMVAPDKRDALSDLYRMQEDANLKLNIREGGLLGKGFGVPIDYALPIADIKSIDPFIAYIPHNGVLYILMRIGLLGAVAFWSLLAAGIVSGARLAASRDRELGAIGAVLASAMVAYALEGAVDQGFFMYRIAFVVGCLLGLAEAARRLERRIEAGP